MSQRNESITPPPGGTIWFPITPITAKEAQTKQELADVMVSIALLKSKLDKLPKATAAVAPSITVLEEVIDGVIDPKKLPKPDAKLAEFTKAIQDQITRMQGYEALVNAYDAFLSANKGLALYENMEYFNSTTKVMRFGINTDPLNEVQVAEIAAMVQKTIPVKASSVSSKASKKEGDFPHLLHPIEVIRIKEAIAHCNKTASKTVLVDIFERDDKGNILIGDDKKPGIHTIVLCMQDDGASDQILVIDPSNSDFSKHIAYNNGTICGYDKPKHILIPNLQISIYSVPSGAKTGPNPHEYRDCTDIAAKLAFGLEHYTGAIDMSKLADLTLVKEVTNNDTVNTNLGFDFKKVIARIRQATEDSVRSKAEKLMVATTRQAKCAKIYDDETQAKKFLAENESFFSGLHTPDQYDAELAKFDAIHKSHVDLIGSVMKDSVI